MKKSYHSMAVPTKLASATRPAGTCSPTFSPPSLSTNHPPSAVRLHILRSAAPDLQLLHATSAP